MSVDPTTLAAIIAMAVVTYLTRIAGLALPANMKMSPRVKSAFEAIPPAVLVAVIAPTALATGWRESLAAVVCILAATRLPLLGVVGVGVVTIVLLRLIG
ncbi:AzlD family protein [Terrarubrum flagellatum]|uniref:AzlD family protein n=1 Tax=Terrirubrum flagellatum TaxID=2895980 RepID=UPI00314550FC